MLVSNPWGGLVHNTYSVVQIYSYPVLEISTATLEPVPLLGTSLHETMNYFSSFPWLPTIQLPRLWRILPATQDNHNVVWKKAGLSSCWTERSSKEGISSLEVTSMSHATGVCTREEKLKDSIKPLVWGGLRSWVATPKAVLTRKDFCIFALLHGLVHATPLQFTEFNTVEMWHCNLMVERPQIPSVEASWPQAKLKPSYQWDWFLQLPFLTFLCYALFSLES